MQTIVVGFDGSEASERALERAAQLAEALPARLVVVSVEGSPRVPATVPLAQPETVFVPSSVGGGMPPAGTLPEPVPEPAQPQELAQRQLEQARMRLARRRVDADYVAEVGPAAERLLAAADEHAADLLVVGSSHHSLLERLLARPVDEAVARRADRDVLLVH